MKSSTRPLNHTSKISDQDSELIKAIQEELSPATRKFNENVDVMASRLLKALTSSGEISDKEYSAFLDSLMISTSDLYDRYQEILTEMAVPLSAWELEEEKQNMMNIVIDNVASMLNRANDMGITSI